MRTSVRPELAELLLSIVSASWGTEHENTFLRRMLSEIHRCLGAQSASLYLDGDFSRPYIQYPYQEDDSQDTDALLNIALVEWDRSSRSHPIITDQSHDIIHLIAPLQREKSPVMMLCLTWKDVPPPNWTKDTEMLTQFCEELGKYFAWHHILFQITEAKRHLQSIFDELPSPICVTNENFVIERVNRAFSEFFEVPFSQAIGKQCFEVVHRTDAPSPQCRLKEVLADKEEVSCRSNGIRKLKINFLPIAKPSTLRRAIEIFEDLDDVQSGRVALNSRHFLKVYESLSQPLTVLALLSGMIISNENQAVSNDHMKIMHGEILRIISILKEFACDQSRL